MGAGVILVLLGLFLYGAATNPAYGWATYTKYLFNERILFGRVQHAAADRLRNGAGRRAGDRAVGDAPVAQSGVPVGGLGVPLDFPRHAGLRAAGVLGPAPTIYQKIQLGIPFGPSFFHLNLQSLSIPFLLALVGLGLNEAAYMAESSAPESHPCPRARPRPPPPWACRGE